MTTETDQIEADLQSSRHRLSDTLNQIGGKLSPGQILDEGLGLLQGQAGEFAQKLGRQVRDNPVPTLLVAAGVAMLFMNKQHQSRVSHEDWHSDRRYRALEQARWSTQRSLDESDADYQGRLHGAYAKALDLRQFADESAEAFKQRVSDMSQKIEQAAHAAREKFAETFSGASHFAQNQGAQLKHGVEKARDSATDFYDSNPLAVGAIALAVGAVLGSAAPLTDPERQTLRGVADKAAGAGADLAERGARMVQDKLEPMH